MGVGVHGLVEARLKEGFALWRGNFKFQNLERAYLGHDSNHKPDHPRADSRLAMLFTPLLLIARPGEPIHETASFGPLLTLFVLALLHAPSGFRKAWNDEAHRAPVGTDREVQIAEHVP